MLLFESDYQRDLGYIEKVFTEEECDKFLEFANTLPTHEGITGVDPNNSDEKVRKSKVAWILPSQENLWMYSKLRDIIVDLNNEAYKLDIYGFTEALQFTTYEAPGDHYTWHCDKFIGGPIRKLSFVLQLTDPNEYEGGELLYTLGEKHEVVPKGKGTICVFPSYVLHKVTPVTKGKRQTLVGWLGGPNFK
jgi:PKHD-type hydroxylase